MQLLLAYKGRSALRSGPAGLALALSPNLRRDRVAFEGILRDPLRFREAIGALHEVVVGDLKYRPKDHTAYQEYLAEHRQREAALRQVVTKQAEAAILEGLPELPEPYPPELERDYRRRRRQYWKARDRYARHLYWRDPELWRLLLPCDPIITVAPDVLFLECFSADESSYGCLSLGRDAFEAERDVALGTTNVDYSWSLYEHFQRLRSYRETRFLIDPSGFEVQTGEVGDYREAKIDLPPSWLRGFLQLQAAMSLPMRRVPLDRAGLYNVLAFLKRHRARRSPRALRFELEPGKPVSIVLEPWEERIVLHETIDDGPRSAVVRVWGRDRLRVLARLLPLIDGAEVYLLGDGLPSFWSIRLGEMRFLLGLSGWTANDWTSSAALDQLVPPVEPDAPLLASIASAFRDDPTLTFEEIQRRVVATPARVAAGLNRLALLGQVIHDLHTGVYRWRRIMPVALSMEQIGPDHPETEAARTLLKEGKVHLDKEEHRPDGLRVLEVRVRERPVTLVLDADGRMLRGKCSCSHHHTGGLRRGPCRHLQALRESALRRRTSRSVEEWFRSFWT
ncbi:SWIM zinc finger domain-containing protein [soil metagenome]